MFVTNSSTLFDRMLDWSRQVDDLVARSTPTANAAPRGQLWLPPVDVSPDPYDNFLLSIAAGGRADYLVTGDKADLLALGRHGGTRIVTVAPSSAMKLVGLNQL